QKPFFEGNINTLSPMSLKDIAQALERNESTISRAINNKHMETPQGLYPLKHYFAHAVNENNKDTTSHTIKEEIKSLIENEDKSNPLSDLDIITHFESRGIKMARRTVNKYRLELNIPSSHKRKV
ncbi:MAG: RNA polymerase sigma-54 factor, partial [Candidatus Omnitrophica bacterium]|nr:RNA polymerase sigma-54 factor [Candidatus Omnitrophota bacterium]